MLSNGSCKGNRNKIEPCMQLAMKIIINSIVSKFVGQGCIVVVCVIYMKRRSVSTTTIKWVLMKCSVYIPADGSGQNCG